MPSFKPVEPGTKFGRLVYLKEGGRGKYKDRLCWFECDCGTIKNIQLAPVRRGAIVSCGCKAMENIKHKERINFANIIPGKKRCACCKNYFSLDCFAKNSTKPDGFQERCNDCRKNHYHKVKHKIPKRTKERRRKDLLKSYGLNEKNFADLLKKQNGVCAICKTDEWGKISPSIDHCHKTGLVRGLLCSHCNTGLGLFEDNESYLLNAAEYLKNAKK